MVGFPVDVLVHSPTDEGTWFVLYVLRTLNFITSFHYLQLTKCFSHILIFTFGVLEGF